MTGIAYDARMGGEFAAAAAVLRRPLRRWWRRSGVAWVLFTAVLLALQAGWLVYEWHTLVTGYMRPAWTEIWLNTQWMTPLCAALLWLLAAFQVVSVLKNITASIPVPEDRTRQAWLRFALCVRQGTWPVVVLACHSSLVQLYFDQPVPMYSHYPVGGASIAGAALHGSADAMQFAVVMFCVMALLAVLAVPRSLLWYWFAAAFIMPWTLTLLHYLDISFMRATGSFPLWYRLLPHGLRTEYDYSPVTLILFSLAATALFLLLLRLFLYGRQRAGQALGWSYASAVLIGSVGAGSGLFYIDWLLVGVTKLATPFAVFESRAFSSFAGRAVAAALDLLLAYLLIRAALLWPVRMGASARGDPRQRPVAPNPIRRGSAAVAVASSSRGGPLWPPVLH